MENPGIDPGTSRMQSGRSTTWLIPQSMIQYYLERSVLLSKY